jgi:hypothetical protein
MMTSERSLAAPAAAGGWGVPTTGELVAIGNADAMMLLTTAYVRMSVNEGGSSISALTHVMTSARAFSGVCLTESISITVEHEALLIPVRLIRGITGSRRKRGWRTVHTATVELIDGSCYKDVRIKNSRLSVLTMLGCQTVDVTQTGVAVRGHSVREIAELRDRLGVTLEKHQQAIVRTIGPARFERFFRRAA